MEEKVIGILGGMGPEATLDLFQKIIEFTDASKDQDHLRVIIDSNPKIPDRTEAILGRGEDPVPMMVRSVHALERAGASFVVIPCVSAHFFLEELRSQVDIPILSIFDETANYLIRNFPDLKTVGVLASTGTVRGGRFQKRDKASQRWPGIRGGQKSINRRFTPSHSARCPRDHCWLHRVAPRA